MTDTARPLDLEMLEMLVRHKKRPGFVSLSDADILGILERLKAAEARAEAAVEGMRIANEDADKWAVRAKAAEKARDGFLSLASKQTAELASLKRIEAAAQALDGLLTLVRHRGAAMMDDDWKRDVDQCVGEFRAAVRAPLSPAEEESNG